MTKDNILIGDREINYKIQLILKWINGKPAQPFAVNIASTDSCNLQCLFCGRGIKDSSNELSDERLIQVVHEAGKMGVRVMSISGGGEPLYRQKTTLKLLKTIKTYGMGGAFTTNGTLFTEKIIKAMVKIGWDRINFSIDAPDAETHNFLRNAPGVFESAISALKRFQYWKCKLNKFNPEINLHTVLVNQNYDKIDQMIELAYNVGASGIIFIPVQPRPRNEWAKKLQLTEREMNKFQERVNRAKQIANKLQVATNLDDFVDRRLITDSGEMDNVMVTDINDIYLESDITFPPCFEPWFTLSIYPNGEIGPCEQNILSHLDDRNLNETWYYDDALNKFRKKMIKNELPKICSICCEHNIMRNRILRSRLMMQIKKYPSLVSHTFSKKIYQSPIIYKS